jgi:hypothetical protein
MGAGSGTRRGDEVAEILMFPLASDARTVNVYVWGFGTTN